MCSSPKIHDLSSPINDWRQETNETQNYALLATELHTKYTFARKQQQQKWKKLKHLLFRWKKRSFSPRPVSHRTNDLKYSDKFKITPLGWGCTQPTTYRIYSVNRQGHLLNFWTLRVGTYSWWVLIRGWALIKFSPFSESEGCLFATKQKMLITKHEEVTKQGFCKIPWRKLHPRGRFLLQGCH